MTCEIIGEVNKFHHNKPCTKKAERRVSVNELSPLHCCLRHAVAIKMFWEKSNEVVILPLES